MRKGNNQATIPLEIIADNYDEDNENFTLALSNESNATVASDEARQINGTIEDDDNPPVASISATYAVGEGDGANDADGLVVTLSAPSTKTVTVSYAFEDGTAIKDMDYMGDNGDLGIYAWCRRTNPNNYVYSILYY